jgi:hypothetical protein
VDAPTADSSGGTPPAEGDADSGDEQIEMPPMYVGQMGADDTGNDEIEMPPMYVMRDADAGDGEVETPLEEVRRADAGGDEIEMPPMYVGRGGDDGQEPNDAPDPSGGTPPAEDGGQTGADAGGDEIEMPPEYVGRPLFMEYLKDIPGVEEAYKTYIRDAAHEEELKEFDTYEKLEGYVRELHRGLYEGSDPELVETLKNLDISSSEHLDTYDELKAQAKELIERRDTQAENEQPPEDVGQTGADAGGDEIEMPPMYVGRTGLDAAHEEELAQYGTHEELAGLYRSLNENLYERYPDLVEGMNKQLESREDLHNYEELKAATKGLLEQWYLRDAHHQRLEGRYSNEISGDPGLQTYDQLADYYKNLSMVLGDSDQEPDMTGLDTYEKLKVGTYELWEQRDQYLKQHEGEQHLEEKDESHTNDSHNNAPEIEMPPMYVGRDAGGQEPNDAFDPSGGTPRPETVGQVGADAAHEEIEFTPEEAAAIPAQPDDAGNGEIEMDPEYVGRSDWHKVADKFEEKFGEDELMLQMKFRQMAEDNPELRVALKNVFGWEDASRSDWEKVLDKFEEKFGEDELVQHIEFRQTVEDNPTLREVAKNVFGYDHPGKDVEIEMPPEYVGQAGVDTGVNENDIEMFPNDAGWLGADTGVDENDIEMLP